MLDDDALKSIALELGSDCPFFIDCTPAYATGRGEIMVPCAEPILNNHYMILLNPGIEVNTREAYQSCHPAEPGVSLQSLTGQPLDKWKDNILNDFEKYAFGKHPRIKMLKEELYRAGALFSLMSGSGSSVFGIFRIKPRLPARLKEFIIWQGAL
jgi:4-diphosphocytidyl-2-C-methyl-D-erythritol kinase